MVETVNDKRGMRSFGGVKIGFDTEMKIHCTRGEPEAFAFGHRRRLGDLRKAQDSDVKGASSIVAGERNGDLYVLDAKDFHVHSVGR